MQRAFVVKIDLPESALGQLQVIADEISDVLSDEFGSEVEVTPWSSHDTLGAISLPAMAAVPPHQQTE